MRIQPRKQVLDIWESLLRTSYDTGQGKWRWGSEDKPNSIADAEQLLCLLHPMNEMDTFALHDADGIKSGSDVENVLRPSFVGRSRVPAAIVDICSDYLTRHTNSKSGQPVFTGGSYLFAHDPDGPKVTAKQRDTIEVVDAYSMSITLCLAMLAFVKRRTGIEHNSQNLAKLRTLADGANRRLTAAMTGLVRCFVVNAMYRDDPGGRVMLDSMGRARPDLSVEALMDRFHDRHKRTRARLRSNISLGIPDSAMPDDEQLFEIGWAWGVAQGAGPVDFVESLTIADTEGVAEARPYLYFTVVALDGIVDLFSPSVRELDLFDETQTRLVDALRVRWELTQRYWSAMARFDPDAWPLQDLPWRTSDGDQSDYYSLLVTSVLIKDFDDRAPTASDLNKAVSILSELAGRAKITRRLTARDPAMGLHWPGTRLSLTGSDKEGPLLAWHAFDFTPVLLKRSCQAMRLTNEVDARENLMRLAEAAMDQLELRRHRNGSAAGLWDDVSRLDTEAELVADGKPSWYFTERIIEALVTAASAFAERPPRSDTVYDHLLGLLSEADHLYNQQLMATDITDGSKRRSDLDTIDMLISQARRLDRARSSTAEALAYQALLMLNGLGQARVDARRGG